MPPVGISKTKLAPKSAKSPPAQLVAALKSENAKLQKHIAKLEAQAISCKNQVAALKAELDKAEKSNPLIKLLSSIDKT